MIFKPKNEILYMNYMKFFGILYLLIWHAALKGPNLIVISFFLQLFFFVSGYFYNDTYSEKPLLFLRKRIISLYFPFVIYCSIFLVLNNVFVNFHLYESYRKISSDDYLYHFIQIITLEPSMLMAGGMWFVSALLLSSILFCLINAILIKIIPPDSYNVKNCIVFFIMLFIFLLGYYLPSKQIYLIRYIDISFVLVFFYYIGFLYKKYEEFIPMNIYLAVLSLFILLICSSFGGPRFIIREYVNPFFILFCGLSGIYLNLYISKIISAYFNNSFVNYAGKNTMIILAFHFLAFKVASIVVIYSQKLPIDYLVIFPTIKSATQLHRVLYVITGLLIPLMVKYTFDKCWNRVSFVLRARRFI